MATRGEILGTLTKSRLAGLAQALGLKVSSRRTKSSIVCEMASSRRFTTLELLESLTVVELKSICVKLKKPTTPGFRQVLVHQLTGDKKALLRSKIIASLKQQGFRQKGDDLLPPLLNDKDAIRALHKASIQHKRDRSRPALARHESDLLGRFASGSDLDIGSMHPELIEVKRGSENELLFRYACLHWSIPVSSGYGRRLRFIVTDKSNGKLIGVLGIGDPVYALSARDQWIGFSRAGQKDRLRNVVDAFVLGAVPPYSHLLCGKLVAMLATSNEVRCRFREKYKARKALISEVAQDGELAMLTTTSALGRSSIYNRLGFRGRKLFHPVGYTQGYGDFQFLNGLYDELFLIAKDKFEPTAKQESWGGGFRNRREVVKKCLSSAGLSEELLRHGVKRQIFLAPLASNAAAFLRGDNNQLLSHDQSADALFDYFRERWLMPRIGRLACVSKFDPQSLALWPQSAKKY